MVDLHRQYLGIRDEVDRAIGDVIAETAFIKGPAVGLFEEELARRLEVRHCIACGNGTDALLLSLLAVLAPHTRIPLPGNARIRFTPSGNS